MPAPPRPSARRRSCRRRRAGGVPCASRSNDSAASSRRSETAPSTSASEGEQDGDQRRGLQHREGCPRDGLPLQRPLERRLRGHGEHRERRLAQSRLDRCPAARLGVHPGLGRKAGARRGRVQRGLEGRAVGDHEVVRPGRRASREALRDRRHPEHERLAGDVDSEHPVRAGDRGQARRDDCRDAKAVGRLARADVGVHLVGQREAEAQAIGRVEPAHARRPGPARVVRHHLPAGTRISERDRSHRRCPGVCAALVQLRRRLEAEGDETAAAQAPRDRRREELRPRADGAAELDRRERAVRAPRMLAATPTSVPETAIGSSSLVAPGGSGSPRRRHRPGRREPLRQLGRRARREVTRATRRSAAARARRGPRRRCRSRRSPPGCSRPGGSRARPVRPDGASARPPGSAPYRTGTSCDRSSWTTASAGTAYAAWSSWPRTSVERYDLGEEREPDRDDDEADRDRRVPGPAREAERRQAERERVPGHRALQQPQAGREQPRRGHGGREPDERGQQEQHDAGAVVGKQVGRCRRRLAPARPRPSRPHRAPRRRAARASAPAPRPGARSERRRARAPPPRQAPAQGRCRGPRARNGGAARRPARRYGPATAVATAEPGDPPHERAAERHRRRLGDDEQPDLPATGAAGEKPPPRRVHIRPKPRRRQHREGEQERDGLAAEQQQPPAGDRRLVSGGAQLVQRSSDREAERLGLEHRLRVLDPVGQSVDRPRPDRAALEGHDPAVAAVRVVQPRRARPGRRPRSRARVAAAPNGGSGRSCARRPTGAASPPEPRRRRASPS